MPGYHKEAYWNEVAVRVRGRQDGRQIAGDDDPYYHYKRSLFLDLFNSIDFSNRSVLEIGSGPGGNLLQLTGKGCSRIAGADISEEMIGLARSLLQDKKVELVKTDGLHLPFPDRSFDVVFTSTVLQHNTAEDDLNILGGEMARVSGSELLLFERIEKTIRGNETNTGRPVSYYRSLLEPHGFGLVEVRFLPLQASYVACGIIRKLANKKKRKEGEAESRAAYRLQAMILPFTRMLDRLLPSRRDLAMLRFRRK